MFGDSSSCPHLDATAARVRATHHAISNAELEQPISQPLHTLACTHSNGHTHSIRLPAFHLIFGGKHVICVSADNIYRHHIIPGCGARQSSRLESTGQ